MLSSWLKDAEGGEDLVDIYLGEGEPSAPPPLPPWTSSTSTDEAGALGGSESCALSPAASSAAPVGAASSAGGGSIGSGKLTGGASGFNNAVSAPNPAGGAIAAASLSGGASFKGGKQPLTPSAGGGTIGSADTSHELPATTAALFSQPSSRVQPTPASLGCSSWAAAAATAAAAAAAAATAAANSIDAGAETKPNELAMDDFDHHPIFESSARPLSSLSIESFSDSHSDGREEFWQSAINLDNYSVSDDEGTDSVMEDNSAATNAADAVGANRSPPTSPTRASEVKVANCEDATEEPSSVAAADAEREKESEEPELAGRKRRAAASSSADLPRRRRLS